MNTEKNPATTGRLRKSAGLCAIVLLTGLLFNGCGEVLPPEKPALIVTTDIGGDPDDQQSLTRLLIYSNEFDILGLIASASGTRGELGVDTIKPQLIHRHIDAYEAVWPNLVLHDQSFPDPAHLRSVVKRGNPHRGTDFIGAGHDTEASAWIIKQVDENPDRVVNICIWGGQTDVMQALWRVKHDRKTEDYQAFISRVRIYDISDQDGIFGYIRMEHPRLFYILAKAPDGVDKREGAFRGMYLGGDESITSGNWIDLNVRRDHGPLGALYPPKTWTAPNPHSALKEGDTPSWFFFLQNGLQDPAHPEWGGWGGRFTSDGDTYFTDAQDVVLQDTSARATVYRWRNAFQNAFRARMDWCVMTPEEANHAPHVVLNGHAAAEIQEISSSAGQTVKLSASGSFDPDGDRLTCSWWHYPEAGSGNSSPEIVPDGKKEVSINIPEDDKAAEYHIILEVTDNGKPALTSYRRIIINVS